MFQNLKSRIVLIALAILASGWLLLDNYRDFKSPVILGLDLAGGAYLALEVDETSTSLTSEQRADAVERALKVVRMRVDELGVSEPVVQKAGENRIIVELAGLKDENRAKEVIQKTAFLEFQIVRPLDELQAVIPQLDRAVAQAFPREAASAAQAAPVGGLLQQKAGATTDSAVTTRPFSALLAGPGNGGQVLLDTANAAKVERFLANPAVTRALPRGTELLWGVPSAEETPGFRSLYLVTARPMMTGEHLENATAQTDPTFGRPLVAFELTRRGGRTFEKATGENINQLMAIVLDNRVYTAPVIRSQIADRGQIELGNASLEEATDLALVLRAGALPAPLRVVEERSVGPSLGQDSVDNGVLAGAVGIVLVIFLMVGYYRGAGMLAVGGLMLYVLFLLGALAMLDAALTFPGIAGLILSIGMAVDANVLIFERIREELAAGRNVRVAVDEGFRNALSAIVDSNLTTLITAAILFYMGTGPIRGFAVTLAVGIIASMFTAIFVVRTMFMVYLERRPAARTLSI